MLELSDVHTYYGESHVLQGLTLSVRPGEIVTILGRNGMGKNKLSGGEQQMLAIGRALMSDPDLLLMDEPTEGLAPLLVREVGRVIAGLKREGLSILLVEQNLPLALSVADRVHILSRGQIVHSSGPAELMANETVKARYLGVA